MNVQICMWYNLSFCQFWTIDCIFVITDCVCVCLFLKKIFRWSFCVNVFILRNKFCVYFRNVCIYIFSSTNIGTTGVYFALSNLHSQQYLLSSSFSPFRLEVRYKNAVYTRGPLFIIMMHRSLFTLRTMMLTYTRRAAFVHFFLTISGAATLMMRTR